MSSSGPPSFIPIIFGLVGGVIALTVVIVIIRSCYISYLVSRGVTVNYTPVVVQTSGGGYPQQQQQQQPYYATAASVSYGTPAQQQPAVGVPLYGSGVAPQPQQQYGYGYGYGSPAPTSNAPYYATAGTQQ